MKRIILCAFVALALSFSFFTTVVHAQTDSMESLYPFELKDTLGRVVKAADFKGKVMVVDFWFTGCKGCVQLAEMMHKMVLPELKSDTSVVFLSVSIDVNFLQWKRSIRTEMYTSTGQVNLYTMGMGADHPFFKHYRFSGCPQMIVVNQRGKVVSTSVPMNADGLIELIKNSKS